jgi:Rrf2 family transcriptional regulator, nitric oxide-sensitive transcriptional repressor
LQLTAHSDYALRVLIFLGNNPNRRITIDELTEFFAISRNHLVKVVHRLGQNGFITATRGKGGGLSLSKPPSQISIGQVVRAMESHFHIVECFNPGKNNVCRLTPACRLKGFLGTALEQFLVSLDQKSLFDVLNDA